MKKQQQKNRLGWRQRLLWAVPGVALGWFVLVYWLDALQWPARPLLTGVALASLAGAWLSTTALPRLGAEGWLARRRKLPANTWALAALIFAGLVPVGLMLQAQVRVPATHRLEVCAPQPMYAPFVIQGITREDGVRVMLAGIKGDDPWNFSGDTLLTQQSGSCVHYEAFFKGGVVLSLQSGPQVGPAHIVWDGQARTIALDEPLPGSRVLNLHGSHPLGISVLRQALLWAATLALVVLGICVAAGLALALHPAARRATAEAGWLVWLGALAALNLLVMGVVGRNAALAADDFCYAISSAEVGVWQATWNFYTQANGRLLGNFLGMLSGGLSPQQQFPAEVLLYLALWVAALAWAFHGVLHWLGARRPWGAALLLSSLSVLVTLILTPTVAQSLYWRSGREPLVASLIVGSAALGGLLALGARRPLRFGALGGLALASAVAGLFHEAYAAAQVGMLLAALGLVYAYRRPARRATGGGWPAALSAQLFGALAALAVHLFSPGTAARGSVLGASFDPLRVGYGALYDTGVLLFGDALNGLTLALFVIGLGLAARAVGARRVPAPRLRSLSFGVALILAAGVLSANAVGHYALDGLPARTAIIPTYLAVLIAPLAGLLSAPWLLKQLSVRGLRYAQRAALVLLSIVLLVQASSSAALLPEYQHYALSVRSFFASLEGAQAAAQGTVKLRALLPNPYGVAAPGIEERNFVNGCIDRLSGGAVTFE
jgi:hypothetical protein